MARKLMSRRASLLFLNLFFFEVVDGKFTALWRSPGKLRVDLSLLPKTLRPLSTTAPRSVDFRVDYCQGAI